MDDKTRAEALKVEILERRNYLRGIDITLKPTKKDLYGGMQNRVRRQEERNYGKRVMKQRTANTKNLAVVNKYLGELDTYNSYTPEEGVFQTSSQAIAPILPDITLSKTPKGMVKVRATKQGIRGRI